MKRGRKPLPVTTHQARGTLRPGRHATLADAVPPDTLPQQPDWLTADGVQAWLDNIGRVSHTRSATELDSVLFATWCNLAGAAAACWRAGDVPPAAHLAELRRLAEMFGLGGLPSRVGHKPASTEPNPFTKLGVRPPG